MIHRDWTVLLIGGASGSGKSSLSYPLGKYYGVGVLEVDDFQVMLETVTTPELLPAIHYWKMHPDWMSEGAEATVAQLIDAGRELLPGLIAVIKNHLESGTPVILEGDFILPELAASCAGPGVRSVFIHEPDRRQILDNYLRREPDNGLQHYRAEVSCRYGSRLTGSCVKSGVPVVEARPWDNLLERVIAVIS